MQVDSAKPLVFQFVSIEADDTSKAERRRLVRSNAANYQWGQKKRRPLKSKSKTVSNAIRLGDEPYRKSCGQITIPKSRDANADWLEDVTRTKSGDESEVVVAEEMPRGCREFMLFSLSLKSSISSNSILTPSNPAGPLITFNIQFIVPSLVPEIAKGVPNPAADPWVRLAMNSPALYSTWAHCTILFVDVLRDTPDACPHHTLRTHSKAISLLNEQMQDMDMACSDDNLLAVLGLATHGRIKPLLNSKYPRQGPLRDLQNLELYSSMETVPLHLDGLAILVKMRGGLSEIKAPGIAAVISYMGIQEASKSLKRPRWPFVSLGKSIQPFNQSITTRGTGRIIQGHGIGFSFMFGNPPSSPLFDLFDIIQAMCDYTSMIRDHCEGRCFLESLCGVADQRNHIHHSLLSLQEFPSDHPSLTESGDYEAIRLASIAYSFLVIFPSSAASVPFFELSSRIKRRVSVMETSYKTTKELEFLIWILFIGGIASLGSEYRSWFVEQLRAVSHRIEFNSWAKVKTILERFLWLGSTNDPDGMELWLESSILQNCY